MSCRIAIVAFLVYIIPSLFACLFGGIRSAPRQTSPPAVYTQEPVQSSVTVAVLSDGGLREMDLEQYVLCVVLAEMPAEFESQALMAQAVVARTYTCKRMEEPKHSGGAVCTDFACCQAYISVADYLHSGGAQWAVDKVKAAVDRTAGQVLTYQGVCIEATYFSCSGGRTEDAQAVWGNAVPYLQSVDSPGEEKATHYTDTVSFSKAEFLTKLGLSADAVRIGSVSYTAGGGVSRMEICNQSFSGTELRKKLGLRSTALVITAAGDRVVITTKGFGHRVGMSQYGADAMAVQGKDYSQILQHYYRGTEITSMSG